MARIDKPSAFETEPEPGRLSEGSEPWRALKSSLAITFTSKRQRIWCPEELSPDVRSQIIRAIEARGAIAAAEMKLRTAICEMVHEASSLRFVRLDSPVWMQPDFVVRKAAKRIAWESDALSAQRHELSELLEDIDAIAGKLDLLAKGLLQVREERSGSISMTFSLNRRLSLEPPEVEREARWFRNFVREATGVLTRAHDALVKAASG